MALKMKPKKANINNSDLTKSLIGVVILSIIALILAIIVLSTPAK